MATATAAPTAVDPCESAMGRLNLQEESVQEWAGVKYCTGIYEDSTKCKQDCSTFKMFSASSLEVKLCVPDGDNPLHNGGVKDGYCDPSPAYQCTAPPPPPVFSMTYNDPHVRTLSGSSYDMKGVGVFEYASTPKVKSQVYICPIAKCPAEGECMTFISALVVKTKTHTLVASGDSVTVDGLAPAAKWEHGMNHTLTNAEGMITSVGKHDPKMTLMRVSPKELLKPQACHPDHQALIGGKNGKKGNNAWVWHFCSPSGWHISTPELTLNVGVVGPFEEGYLREATKDRSLNLAAQPGSEVNAEAVEGIINGDRNHGFVPHQSSSLVQDTGHVAPSGLDAVTSANVPDDKVLFPTELKEKLDAQCGGAVAMQLSRRRVAADAAMV